MSQRSRLVLLVGLIAPACGPTTTGISTESAASSDGDSDSADTSRADDGDSTDGPSGETSQGTGGPTSAASTGGAETTTDESTDDTSDESADGSTGQGVVADCPALCSVLVDGSCLTESQGAFSCETSCERVLAGQPAEAHDAFQVCAQTNPLCFETPEACVWSTLYPDPFEQTVVYTASGFEAFDGMVVHAGLSEADGVIGLQQATVLDGAFTLEFTEALPVLHSRLILLYVDTNGDAACSPGTDFGDSVNVPVSGNFGAPVFEASGTPPESSHDFVCNSL